MSKLLSIHRGTESFGTVSLETSEESWAALALDDLAVQAMDVFSDDAFMAITEGSDVVFEKGFTLSVNH